MAHISKAVVCACAAAFSVTGTVNAQFPDYHVTEIAIFDIDPDGFPLDLIFPNAEDHGTVAVNNLGEIVYSMDTGTGFHAFVFLPNDNYGLTAGLYDLNTLANETGESIARDINDHGVIVGQIDGIEPALGSGGGAGGEAVAWELASGSATMTRLGRLEANRWSGAYAITNDATDPIITGAAGIEGHCECQSEEPDPEDPLNEIIRAFEIEFSDPLPSMTALVPESGEQWRSSFGRAIASLNGGGVRVAGDRSCGGFDDDIDPPFKCLETNQSCLSYGPGARVERRCSVSADEAGQYGGLSRVWHQPWQRTRWGRIH